MTTPDDSQHSSVQSGTERAVCDYEGSNYQSEFWSGQGRDYEDLVERVAIRRLLPPRGHTLIDVGAGFGRLVDLYAGYDRVILTDYSRTMLRQAQARLPKNDPRFVFVAANVYSLPFVDDLVDSTVMVRVAHHLSDVPAALSELTRIVRPSGTFVLEFANKRNFKSIARYLARRQTWSPFAPEPVEFVRLNYNFHPAWFDHAVTAAGLQVRSRLSVSHFRLPLFKKLVPLPVLVGMDRAIQSTGRWWQLSPSAFLQLRKPGSPGPRPTQLFRCPACTSPALDDAGAYLQCASCHTRWGVEDGLYDFKEPL